MQTLELVNISDVVPYEREDGESMNPRDFSTPESAAHIDALAEQFRANRLNPGQPVMRPILHRDGGLYYIIDGECRVRAMRKIGTRSFWADVYDDLADAELARAEAAKAMVETDCKLSLSEAEMSRGVQQMLALDLPDEEVAAAARIDARTVRRARRAGGAVGDAAYDMTLDRLMAIDEFAGDADAVAQLRDCAQAEWRGVYRALCARRRFAANRSRALALLADAGVAVVGEMPDGYAPRRTLSDWSEHDAEGLAAILDELREEGAVLAREVDSGVTLMTPVDEGRAEADARAEQERVDMYAGWDAAAEARRAWLGSHLRDLSGCPATAAALTVMAWRATSERARAAVGVDGLPSVAVRPTALSVAAGYTAAREPGCFSVWRSLTADDPSWLDGEPALALAELLTAMESDGYEPMEIETRALAMCRRALEKGDGDGDEE